MVDTRTFSKASILVVGDVMLDRYWFGDVERISPEAPVPVLLVGNRDERLGGAANVAINAASLGAKLCLMGVVGHDEPGQTVETMLEQAGVQSRLLHDPQFPTIVKLRVIARQQQLVRIDFEERPSAEHLSTKMELFEQEYAKHDVVVFSDYGKGALEHVADMIALCKQAGKTTLVDPKGDDYAKYAGASVLTPNRSEFRQVMGSWKTEAELHEKAQILRARLNLGALLLTRSEEGMTLFNGEGAFHVPAQAREVFDVSGAGDTVIATLACAIGAGMPLPDSVALANKAGGVVVGKLGTAVILPHELN
ncbi:D-glycero-beta-D-manno-heptose-7-phosphate kinase [Limnobacter humi]|uniref:D-glycero-beta-D-manno-heptose-7-phosphate kinase n=1 Tax=Limnobacter humi TaxID=1778671 RepID=A0ABT1WGD1_9BURK|nr:D-glycero-beta-D-manno-heptose-7-phosphate kinase [Limnobacter humi]MCQ8896581.1 D-glycero-beta-D-manno-heptose-7-phosphate kinase [Limnobacter humi]